MCSRGLAISRPAYRSRHVGVEKTQAANHFGALVLSLTDVPGRLGAAGDNDSAEGDTTLAFEQVPPGSLSLGFEWDVSQTDLAQKNPMPSNPLSLIFTR